VTALTGRPTTSTAGDVVSPVRTVTFLPDLDLSPRMYEVEVKLPADHDAVRTRLAELGAESLGTVVQRDTYYDAPHRRFAETDEALRIRRIHDGSTSEPEPDETRITYKGPRVDSESKTRREHETRVDDGETADSVLEALGFDAVAVVEKHRDSYRVDGYTVTLDTVTDVGDYVEVETESDDVDAAREGAFEVLDDLGLDPTDQVRTSYLGLLLGDEPTPDDTVDGCD
jgi:adenylate cyclase class 2